MKTLLRRWAPWSLGVVLLLTGSASAQQTRIRSYSMNGGFGLALTPSTKMILMVGQPLVGATTARSTKLTAGFLADTSISGIIVSTREEATLPLSFHLEQNYPNPFNPTTSIRYQLPKASDIVIKVYNTVGQEVAELVTGTKPAGYYTLQFDGSNLPSGAYFVRLTSRDYVETKKLMLIK